MVTVVPAAATAFAEVPSFSHDFSFAAGVKLAFEGTSHKPLDVELPATNLDASKSYYLGVLGQSIRGPRVMIVDLLRLESSKLTTADATTSNATAGKARVSSNALSRSETRRLLLNVVRAGEYGALAFNDPVAFITIPGNAGAFDYFVDTMPSVYASSFYLAERGRALVPVQANLAFHVIAVEASTGVSTTSPLFAALPPNQPDSSTLIPSPVDAKIGPYPVFASPSRLEVIDLALDELHDESHRNIDVDFDGATVKLTNAADKLPKDTRVQLLNLTTLASRSVADFSAATELTLAAKKGDRLLLFVGTKDIDPSSRITVAFSRAIHTFDDAAMRRLFTLMSADTADGPYTPIDGVTTFASLSSGRVIEIALAGSIPRGKFYRLALSPEIEEPEPLGRAALKLGQPSGGAPLTAPLNLEFSTREPAGVVGTLNLTSGTVRDLAMSGNVLFVSALDGGIVAYDASDPVKMASASATPLGHIAPPPGTDDTPGQNWAVAVDQHGRLYATALSGFFGVLRSYRVEDFLTGSTQPVAQRSNAIVSWRPGMNIGMPAGTSDPAVTDRPEAIPRKLRLITQDEDAVGYASFELLRAAFNATTPVDLGGGYAKTTLRIAGVRTFAYLTQRVTVVNTTSHFRWSVDVPRNGEATLNVIGKSTESFQIIRNVKTYGVVSLFGYGVGIYDLNAIESNRIAPGDPAFDASYVPVAERVLLDDARSGSACDITGDPAAVCDAAVTAMTGQHCGIANLNFSPEAAIATNGNQLVVWGLESNRGLLELRIDPPARAEDGSVTPAACARTNSLILGDRVPSGGGSVPFAHPRLNTLRAMFKQ
ncbi:MAG TPA: hypothetical protein VN605_07365, partial [Thermoanaerobaculia bacterium]|nr:hypothetical protein [Thermoanaerobaculia bacterium]